MQFKRTGIPGSLLKVKNNKEEISATEIAALALLHMADNSKLLNRFMNLSGLGVDDLREASHQPEFLVGVLDFYLNHEPSLLEFAEARNINPESIVSARATLSAGKTRYD